MVKLVLLGTSYAVPDEKHENTHMALVGGNGTVLIDCAANPVVRLQKAGLHLEALSDLILTHFHPDHLCGAPLLLMDLWLLGRQTPLRMHGLDHCLDRMENLMTMFDWEQWPAFFPTAFQRVPERENALVLDNPDFTITASPVQHLIPTFGLRVESKSTGKVLAYSCDTEPCDAVKRMAAGADVLIHDAAGAGIGHSSAAQAGCIAHDAGVKTLYLIHYKTGQHDPGPLVQEARRNFQGKVVLAEDLMEIEI